MGSAQCIIVLIFIIVIIEGVHGATEQVGDMHMHGRRMDVVWVIDAEVRGGRGCAGVA
jgi:hypothetical protein